MDRVVEILQHNGVLTEVTGTGGSETRQLLPARDLGAFSVADLWQTIRRGYDQGDKAWARKELSRDVQELLQTAEAGFSKGAGNQSVRDWLSAATQKSN